MGQHGHHGHESHQLADIPGFWSAWDVNYILLTVAVAAAYLTLFGPLRNRFANSEPLTRRQMGMFFTALSIFFVAKASPLHFYGMHYLFSAHMLQMSLLFFVMPPFLLGAIPPWLVRNAFQRGWLRKLVGLLTQPLVAIILFNFLFSMYHIPKVFDTVSASHTMHTTYHLLLQVTALMMWWPVACPVPELKRLSPLKKIAYIFIDGAALLPACALIIFAGTPLYEVYRDAPQIIPFLTLLDDQQLGGVLMKLIQEISYGIALWFAFSEWYRKEKEKDKLDLALPPRDLALSVPASSLSAGQAGLSK
ncbi:cytochrome c oxidase assembly protein [Brevibacillus humidisoli]|uniref:cytochrome c oxidase assembly protein n=1 Tax=Brevibacillus humidisoli TaxID=2895522 RepID=UPI001E42A382|nr:cytochrome c oxidase assembly protein [Brevibacillus humidisoli]UFJ42338.1 cytochrome c oxidase assembly protein [Brevibacillus humidisoli]